MLKIRTFGIYQSLYFKGYDVRSREAARSGETSYDWPILALSYVDLLWACLVDCSHWARLHEENEPN